MKSLEGGIIPKRVAVTVLLPLLLLVSIVSPVLPAARSVPSTRFDHVVIMVMENEGYCEVMTSCGGSGSYETSLAQTYSVAGTCQSDSSCSIGGYTATSHPSEGNYISLIGGDNFGHTSDGFCCWGLKYPNIVDRIEGAGLTWNAYAEDASGSGSCSFTPPRTADHFAFLTFSDMQTTARCSHFLSTTSPTSPSGAHDDHEFLAELNSTSPANLIWLTPNDNDNGHDTGVSGGDAYLDNIVPRILGSKMFLNQRAALFIVYDEGKSGCSPAPCNGSTNDYLFANWSGPVVKKGFVGASSYNHYSLLKTLETNWAVSSLTSNDANASPMTEFFTNSTGSPPTGLGTQSPLSPLVIGAFLGASVAVIVFAVAIRLRSKRRPKDAPIAGNYRPELSITICSMSFFTISLS